MNVLRTWRLFLPLLFVFLFLMCKGWSQENSDEEIATLVKHCATLYSSRQYDEALQACQQTLNTLKSKGKSRSNYYYATLLMMAHIYTEKKETEKALATCKDAVQIAKAIYGEKHATYATTLHMLAMIYALTGEYDKAKSLETRALEIRKDVLGEKHPSFAESLHCLSLIYYEMEEYDTAETLLTEAVAIRREVLGENHPDYLLSLKNLKAVNEKTGKTVPSRPSNQRKDMSDVEELGDRAISLFISGKYGEALSVARQVVQMYEPVKSSKPEDYAAALKFLAMIYSNMGQYDDAVKLLKQTINIERNTLGEKHPNYATSLNNLAVHYFNTGEYDKAESLYKQAMDIHKKNDGEKSLSFATDLNNLGALYKTTGEYGQAESLYKNSIEIQEEVLGEKHPEYALSLSNLAELYRVMGEYSKAEPLYQKALSIEKATIGGEHPSYAICLNNLALLYASMSRYDEAEALFKQALAIRKEILGEKHPMYATSLNNLASVYSSRGDYQNAEILYKKALEIRKEAFGQEHRYYGEAMNNLATLYNNMHSYEKSETLYKKAVEIWRRSLGEKHPDFTSSLNNLGVLYGQMNNPHLGFKYQVSSLDSMDKFLNDMAYWASESRQQAYLDTVDPRYDAFYSLLARYFTRIHEEGIKALEAHLAYNGRTVEALATRNRLAILSQDPALSKIISELKDVKRRIANLSLAGPGKASPESHLREIAELEKRKEELETSLARGSAEFAEKKALGEISVQDLADSLPPDSVYLDFVSFKKYDYTSAKWTKEHHYLVFALTRKNDGAPIVRIEDLGASHLIDSLVKNLRTAIAKDVPEKRGVAGTRPAVNITGVTGSLNSISGPGEQLYKVTLQPFETEITNAKTLVISSSGNLNLIPFELLKIPGKDGYLLEHYYIVYSQGRDLIAEKIRLRREQSGEKIVANLAGIVAGPDFDHTRGKEPSRVLAQGGEERRQTLSRGAVQGWPLSFASLPGAMAEGQMIAQMFGDKGVMLSGGQADERTVKWAKKPKFLHFATHGFFLEDVKPSEPESLTRGVGGFRPTGMMSFSKEPHLKGPVELHNPLLRSGLALAGFNRLSSGVQIPLGQDDGILTAAEVTEMNLYGTDLVVLSACETGLGEVQRGEGVAGLRRSFKIAGARNIIMSLWNVPDEETLWLMQEFYTRYKSGDTPMKAMNKARSFVRKKLIARDGIDHPYLWAGFILEGAGLE